MSAAFPHYLLFSEARSVATAPSTPDAAGVGQTAIGQWRFVLESVTDPATLEVAEEEVETDEERLELWAVVRGLEALDQAAHVTLVTRSEYVQHGFRFGLDEWRENAWQWERFGEMVPVKNADLWRRVDRALRFHRVDCRQWRFDRATAGPDSESSPVPAPHFRRAECREPNGADETGGAKLSPASPASPASPKFQQSRASRESRESRESRASRESRGALKSRASRPTVGNAAAGWWTTCRDWFGELFDGGGEEPTAKSADAPG